jgi:hypothetical protein
LSRNGLEEGGIARLGWDAITQRSSQIEERCEANASAFELLLEGLDEGESTSLQEFESFILLGVRAGGVGLEEGIIAGWSVRGY